MQEENRKYAPNHKLHLQPSFARDRLLAEKVAHFISFLLQTGYVVVHKLNVVQLPEKEKILNNPNSKPEDRKKLDGLYDGNAY